MGTRPNQRGVHAHISRAVCEAVERRRLLATLPSGFSESVYAGGLSGATAMEFAPDGKLFVAEQGGTMEVWNNGARLRANFFANTPFALQTNSERGLLGIAFDPNYATNRHVYVYYTSPAADAHNRVSRFTANAAGDLALAGSEDVILELDAHSAGNHNGGAMHFGADRLLYVATGDNAVGANAQSLANRHGKMLRIDVAGDDFPADPGNDYRIPAGNPTGFGGVAGTTGGVNRAIWAIGLRNPFTFAFHPTTGRPFINDVGQNTWEEINEGGTGRNFGWPGTEGPFDGAANPNFTQPFYAYDHGGAEPNGIAITGGAFYAPASQQFPQQYAGDYFFADYGSGEIWSLDLATRQATRFAGNIAAAVDLKVDAVGNLYYLARGAGQVLKVSFAQSQPPTIADAPDDASVTVGDDAAFRVVASGQGPLAYQWQRAERGTTAFANIAGATFPNYLLNAAQSGDDGDRFRVVVTDANGRATVSAFATLTVTVNQPPSATIAAPGGLRNGRFDAGRALTFSGGATDPEQGTLGAGSLNWRVDYLTTIDGGDADRDGLPGITRPYVGSFGGATGVTFTPATAGPYTLADVAYVVTLSATDAQGRGDVERYVVYPNVVTLTAATNPAGLQVTVDGQPFAAPRRFASVVGFGRPIGVATNQSLNGAGYSFVSWSDGGAATHTVVTPAADATYTATFAAVNAGGAPTVVGRTPAAGATINGPGANVDVAFSEAVRNVDLSDFSIGGSAVDYNVARRGNPIHLGNNVWRFPVTGLKAGTLDVWLAPDANDIEDLAGNDLASVRWSHPVTLGPTGDTTAPTLVARAPAAGATVRGSSVNVDLTFNEAVRNVDLSDLSISGSAVNYAATRRANPVHLGNNVWRFAISGLQAGTLNLWLAPDANDLEDLAGNDLASVRWTYTVTA